MIGETITGTTYQLSDKAASYIRGVDLCSECMTQLGKFLDGELCLENEEDETLPPICDCELCKSKRVHPVS